MREEVCVWGRGQAVGKQDGLEATVMSTVPSQDLNPSEQRPAVTQLGSPHIALHGAPKDIC